MQKDTTIMEAELPSKMFDELNSMTDEAIATFNERIAALIAPLRARVIIEAITNGGAVEGDVLDRCRLSLIGSGHMASILDDNGTASAIYAVIQACEDNPLVAISEVKLARDEEGKVVLVSNTPQAEMITRSELEERIAKGETPGAIFGGDPGVKH